MVHDAFVCWFLLTRHSVCPCVRVLVSVFRAVLPWEEGLSGKHSVGDSVARDHQESYWRHAQGSCKPRQVMHRPYDRAHLSLTMSLPLKRVSAGVLPQPELQALLRERLVFVGLGFPYDGPGPMEAIGTESCVFYVGALSAKKKKFMPSLLSRACSKWNGVPQCWLFTPPRSIQDGFFCGQTNKQAVLKPASVS